MTGWAAGSILELVQLQRGHDLPSSKRTHGDVPVIGSAGLTGWHNVAKVEGPGVTVGRSGASIGVVTYVKTPYWPHNAVLFATDFNGNDPRFVYYALKSLDLAHLNSGAAIPSLNRNYIAGVRLGIPPLPTQRRIASILSAYDDLIENNTKRIEILEEMARSLYREWFVHFRFPGHEKVKLVDSELGKIPEGWEVRPLGEVAHVNRASIKRGQEPQTISYVDIASVSTDSIEEYREMPFSEAPGRARRVIREGDVIWSTVRPNRRSYARVHKPPSNPVASTGFAVLSPNIIPTGFIYSVTTTDDFVAHLVNHARGAAYPAVTGKDFEAAKIVVPSVVLIAKFEEMVSPMLLLSGALHSKNSVLRQTRDLLLPKLISGEIDVDALDLPEAS